MNRAVRRSAALGAGVAGGLALATLVVPQLVSTLGPTALGTALLMTLLALLAALGQRLVESLRQRTALENALCAWPPVPLGRADMGMLGVYPAPGPGERYRSRGAEDAALCAALRESRNVVVTGPPGAGKSRATRRAAREVFPAVPVIVPADGDALGALADGSLDLNLSVPSICLWLDGLDRYAEALDTHTLRSLEANVGPTVNIVATIRSKEWDALVNGSGQETEATRTLASNARQVAVTAVDPAAEPDEDDSAVDPELPEAIEPRPRLSDVYSRVLLVLLFAVVVAFAFALHARALFRPAPIDEQVARVTQQVLSSAGAAGAHVVISERTHLRAGVESWILVVEDRPTNDVFYQAAVNGGAGPPPRSDELRIYDAIDGRLHLALQFRPQGRGRDATNWDALGDQGPPGGVYYNDGHPELIAGYGIPDAWSSVLPLGIDWDGRGYRVVSLTPSPPRLSNRGLDAATVRFRREVYQTQITLKNAVRDPRFASAAVSGYAAQAYALALNPVPRLLTAYYAQSPQYVKPNVLDLKASQLRSGSLAVVQCTPTNHACPAPAHEQEVIAPQNWGLDHALLAAWQLVGSRWVAPIRVAER